ncbi:YciI family protein [Hahella sp. NBU794]|uniref:YciI family protein n=1 Tax=Hahella sp. NBU794 TaxID=3422590 RepID=UPI003D6E73DF
MFIVLLKFSNNKSQAGQYLSGHKDWINQGFDDGVFLLVGSLQPSSGGGILAHNTSLAELHERVNADPFVAEDIVAAEIIEVAPSNTDARLQFLMN